MDEPSDGASEQHPALVLNDALAELADVGDRADLFLALAEGREAEFKSHQDFMAVKFKRAEAQAIKRSQAGASSEDAYKEVRELERQTIGTLKPTEPVEHLASLNELLLRGCGACVRARTALEAGGAQGLDAALAAGTARYHVEIRVNANEFDWVLQELIGELQCPIDIIRRNAEKMHQLGK